jgi:hypothetical protein
MHKLEPARLKPGVTLESLPAPAAAPTAVAARPGAAGLVRGRALIFWDPKVPGKKLDAIDTDQITPAADCVSESLETLDERWKAGSFRHLMPDFRARVHRGETFLVAGDRFAIGSSREMSPAGLKGVAEEMGLTLVVVCGNNMGDIFRRNAFKPRPARRAEPGGRGRRAGRRHVHVRPRHAPARERDARQVVRPGAAHAQGGRDPALGRDLRGRPARVPRRHRSPA